MRYWTVDVFSDKPFLGNAAGVFLCEEALSQELYEQLALELFQTETAFITSMPNLHGHFYIRCFSPFGEKKTPGHSLFAAAQVLWEEEKFPLDHALYFEAHDGIKKMSKSSSMMSLTLPRSEVIPTASPDRLSKALGTLPVSVSECNGDLIVELHDEDEIQNISVDFSKLSSIEFNRVIITAEEKTGEFDYVCRVFAPKLGHDEESANIQSHCDLASFWFSRVEKNSFRAKQLGIRSGIVLISLDEDLITLSGEAVVVASGHFRNIGM